MKKEKSNDLKICDLDNGKVLIVMSKDDWKTIVKTLELAIKYYKILRGESDLENFS